MGRSLLGRTSLASIASSGILMALAVKEEKNALVLVGLCVRMLGCQGALGEDSVRIDSLPHIDFGTACFPRHCRPVGRCLVGIGCSVILVDVVRDEK